MKYKREKVLVDRNEIIFDQFDQKSLDDFIWFFTNLRDLIRKDYPDHTYTISVEPYGYDGAFEVYFNVFDEESDETYNKRVKKLEQAQRQADAKKLEKERKLYEQLKKKFGDSQYSCCNEV